MEPGGAASGRGAEGVSVGVIGVLGMVAVRPLFAVPSLWDAPSPVLINPFPRSGDKSGS